MPDMNWDMELQASLQNQFHQDNNLKGYGLNVDVVQGEAQLSG